MSEDKDEKRLFFALKLIFIFWVVMMMILTFGANHAR